MNEDTGGDVDQRHLELSVCDEGLRELILGLGQEVERNLDYFIDGSRLDRGADRSPPARSAQTHAVLPRSS